jgi:4-amino-4-deoxy-L-arabinose transferase-like glycosyltransferase
VDRFLHGGEAAVRPGGIEYRGRLLASFFGKVYTMKSTSYIQDIRYTLFAMDWFKKNYPLLIVLIIAFLLRFVNLGYSDFQGDEIKALFIPDPSQKLTSFFMDQRKGPMQWFVTGAVKLVDPAYTHRFVDRFPFALAGLLAVFFFYKLVEGNFSKKIAFYSSLFFATNGLFVAFSRIMQYQSLVILFMVLALYMFSLSSKSERWKDRGLTFGFIFWALSILSHYDGVFIAPFAFYFLYPRLKDKHLWLSLIVPGLMLAAFYIPFVLSISAATMSYWQERLQGLAGKISSSRYLFDVYQPIYVIDIYTLFAALGFIYLIVEAIQKRRMQLKHVFVVIWFLLPAVFMEGLVSIPGTHIYTYILPLTIILGMGIVFIEGLIAAVAVRLKILKPVHVIKVLGLALVFAFISLQTYTIFVNNTTEYPWEDEKFLIFTLKQPSLVYNLSLFGFPYNRHWEEIKTLVDTAPNNGYYWTNEKDSISGYFVPLKEDPYHFGYFIYVLNPQSFYKEISNKRIAAWMATHDPLKIYYDKNGRPVTKVYYIQ